MKAYPPAADLLSSASQFLREELLPTLRGAPAFNLRVAINAVELVRRSIVLQSAADENERRRLAELLNMEASLEVMRRTLCDRIAAGEFTLDHRGLRKHLRATAIDRLAIDQPTYSAYLAAIAERGADTAENSSAPGI
jgi:Domain of unknown function (DUF6285)